MSNTHTIRAIEKLYQNVLWTHRVHENDADICFIVHGVLRALSMILTTLALILFFFQFYSTEKDWWGLITLALGVFLQLFEWGFEPSQKFDKHRSTAKSLLFYRDELNNLIAAAKDSNISMSQLRDDQTRLTRAIHDVYSVAPQTTKFALWIAKSQLVK